MMKLGFLGSRKNRENWEAEVGAGDEVFLRIGYV
jgi:hypothetical protein